MDRLRYSLSLSGMMFEKDWRNWPTFIFMVVMISAASVGSMRLGLGLEEVVVKDASGVDVTFNDGGS
jgi:hypothetical protein